MSILENVETSAEASRQWGLDPSTVKKRCGQLDSKLIYKKSGGTKIVTRSSMDEEYGTILERIIFGKHNNPSQGLYILWQRGELTFHQIAYALTLPPVVRRDAIALVTKDKNYIV